MIVMAMMIIRTRTGIHIDVYECLCINAFMHVYVYTCLYMHIIDKKKTDITDYDGDGNNSNQSPNRYIHIDICAFICIYILYICAYICIYSYHNLMMLTLSVILI
jgi:hypothetical protein